MRTGNTMDKFNFLFLYLTFFINAAIIVSSFFYIHLFDLTYWQSVFVFVCYYIFSSIIILRMTILRHRNMLYLVTAFLFVVNLYIAVAYFQYFYEAIITLFFIALLLIILYLYVYIKSLHRRKISPKLKTRICFCVIFIFTCTYTLFTLFLSFQRIFGIDFFKPNVQPIANSYTNEYSLNNNKDEIANIKLERWVSLTFQERLDLLQIIANIECSSLGLPHELNVVGKDLDDNLLGYHNDSNHIIAVNIDEINSYDVEQCINILCHEAYHAYQHRQVDAYNQLDEELQNLQMFADIKHYKEEFEGNYVDGVETFIEYYEQICEQKSREYAEMSTAKYFEFVEENE